MCPNLTFPKSALEPRPNLPSGQITVVFGGFKPKLSKKQPDKEQSVNMNPVLTIINDSRTTPDGKPLNGQKLFESLNLSFLPRVQDFVHAFGATMTENGDNVDLPGYFDGDTNNPDPSKWGNYHGPLEGEQATLLLAEVPKRDNHGNTVPGKTQTDIQRYLCRVPGCAVNHMETLIR
jgi:hypothetical protein